MSTSSGRTRRRGGPRRDRFVGGSLTRYDLILVSIPVAFVATILVAQLLSIAIQTALTGAAIAGAVGVVDALFLNPPTDGP